MRKQVGKLLARVASATRQRFKIDRYRPEVYYMRGPGPKALMRTKPCNVKVGHE